MIAKEVKHTDLKAFRHTGTLSLHINAFTVSRLFFSDRNRKWGNKIPEGIQHLSGWQLLACDIFRNTGITKSDHIQSPFCLLYCVINEYTDAIIMK